MFRWSLAHLSLLDATPPQLVAAAARAGFGNVGLRLWPARPGEMPHPMHEGSAMLADTRTRMADLGVRVHDVEVIRLSAAFDAGAFEPMMGVAASLGARYVVVNCDDPNPVRAAGSLAALAQLAASHGLTLGVEFMVYTALPDLRAARALVQRAAQPNVRILVDTLHLMRSGADPSTLAEETDIARDFAQFSDAAARPHPALSPGEEARGHRLLPGEGELPLVEIARNALTPGAMISVEAPSAVRRHHLSLDQRASLAWRAAQSWHSSIQGNP